MKEAILYKKLTKKNVKCAVCERRCTIAPGKEGFCGTRYNKEGKLYTLIYEVVSAINVDPIEKKPLYNFHPGTNVFSIGSLGCNFRCKHCQNWNISFVKVTPPDAHFESHLYTPAEIVKMAKAEKCQGIAFTYNEPTIWLEYVLDVAKLAKKEKLFTVFVTNGYITPEALDKIGPFIDAFRVDIKGFSNKTYKKLANIPDFEKILEVTKRAKKKWKMHIECVTNIIPTINDGEKELSSIASWIKNELGKDTPWHVTRFHPSAKLIDLPETPIETLEIAYAIGMREGLNFVYFGNIGNHPKENTYCPNCQKEIITRDTYHIRFSGISGEKCIYCDEKISIINKKKIENIIK